MFRKLIRDILKIDNVTFLVHCKDVVIFKRLNYKWPEDHNKQLRTTLN